MFPTPLNKMYLSLLDQQRSSLKYKKSPITDDYTISKNVLGSGISGKVKEVFSNSDGQKYALKILKDNFNSRREVELHWKSSAYHHVVNIKDVYENSLDGQNHLLIVMECMEGGELFVQILDKKGKCGLLIWIYLVIVQTSAHY